MRLVKIGKDFINLDHVSIVEYVPGTGSSAYSTQEQIIVHFGGGQVSTTITGPELIAVFLHWLQLNSETIAEIVHPVNTTGAN